MFASSTSVEVMEKPSWEPPKFLKVFADWYKSLAALTGVVGAVASFIFGTAVGALVAAGVAAAFLAAYLIVLFSGYTRKTVDEVATILDTSDYKQIAEKREVSAKLKSLHTWSATVLVGFVLVSFALAVVVAWPPLVRWYTTWAPSKVEFAEVKYYNPSRDAGLLEQMPELEAILAALKDEGIAEGKPFRIFWGNTVALPHPTPQFSCSLVVEGGSYRVSGYAFRKHDTDSRLLHESIPLRYPRNESVIFDVRPSEKGDRLFVVARLSLLQGTEFPTQLGEVTSLRLVSAEAK